MEVAYWRDNGVEVLPSTEGFVGMPADRVLWVDGPDGVVCGHDHYWVADDGSVGYAEHHDYDTDGWPVVPVVLPDDRPVLAGIELPDGVWTAVRPR